MVVHVDDRTLTHLQIVIINKFRKGESFMMSWVDATDVGSGRTAVWLHPTVSLSFKFDGNRVPTLNEGWLAELSASADSSRGLVVTTESRALAPLVSHPGGSPVHTVLKATMDLEKVAPVL